MCRHLLSVLGVLSLLIGLVAMQGALAATTTLTFDEYLDSTTLSTRYQSARVTISGAGISNAVFTPWPANTRANMAFAPTGLQTFTLNSTISDAIQAVSAYVSGDTSTGIYAYDAAGVLVGQSVTLGATTDSARLCIESRPFASILFRGRVREISAME